jgi:hypothetical protein
MTEAAIQTHYSDAKEVRSLGGCPFPQCFTHGLFSQFGSARKFLTRHPLNAVLLADFPNRIIRQSYSRYGSSRIGSQLPDALNPFRRAPTFCRPMLNHMLGVGPVKH